MDNEEKLLYAKTEDLFRKCDKRSEAQFSFFLNETEQAFIKREIGSAYGYNTAFFGGYEGAGRKVFGVFPEWAEADNGDFPISAVKIVNKYKKQLSHRDFLGSIMSNGITREQVGDIIVDDDVAYVFMISELAGYIAMNLKKIGNIGVKASLADLSEIKPPEQKFLTISSVAASLRLDAVTAAMLKISRKDAHNLIAGGAVGVNHSQTENTSLILKEGDIISVRGFGRFVFEAIGNRTGSQRLHITVKKYL